MHRRSLSWRIGRSALLIGICVVVIGIVVFPVYWALALALEKASLIFAATPHLFPAHPILANFRAAWRAESGSIGTSVVIACGVVILTIAVAVPAAYGLIRYSFRATAVVVLALLVAQMIPGISLSLSFYSMFHDVGLLNSRLGLILADSTYAVPFAVLVLRAYMGSISTELFDAADVDGAGPMRSFWSVGLPLAIPGIITASLFSFVFAWGDFLFAFTLTNSSTVQPLTLGLYKFVGTYGSDWGPIMATVVLAAIPSGIMLALAQRWVVGGLRAGALKG